jgi:hypothetical protein
MLIPQMVVQMSNKLKCYIVTFGGMKDRWAFQNFLDTRHEVLNWSSCFPNGAFVVSHHSSTELTFAFQSFFVPGDNFFVGELAEDKNGIMPSALWDFVNFPKSSGRR